MAVIGESVLQKKIFRKIIGKFYFYHSVGEHFNPNNSVHGAPENNLLERVNIKKVM